MTVVACSTVQYYNQYPHDNESLPCFSMPRKDCRGTSHPFLRTTATSARFTYRVHCIVERELVHCVRPALSSCWYLDLLSNDEPLAGVCSQTHAERQPWLATFGLVSLHFSRQALYYLAVIALEITGLLEDEKTHGRKRWGFELSQRRVLLSPHTQSIQHAATLLVYNAIGNILQRYLF